MTRSDRKLWTAADDEILRQSAARPAKEVAKILDRSVTAVYTRRSALGAGSERSAHPQPLLPPPAPSQTAIEPIELGKPTEKERPRRAPARPLKSELVPSADMLLINVKPFEELYERLKRSAQANFRAPELQAMWFIHQGLAAEDGARDQ